MWSLKAVRAEARTGDEGVPERGNHRPMPIAMAARLAAIASTQVRFG